MITVCTPLEPRTIAKIADSAMALSRKKPCFFVKIGTRSLGQCWITRHIAATRMIARSAPSPSSPAPSARRYAALGLDGSVQGGLALSLEIQRKCQRRNQEQSLD